MQDSGILCKLDMGQDAQGIFHIGGRIRAGNFNNNVLAHSVIAHEKSVFAIADSLLEIIQHRRIAWTHIQFFHCIWF